jgi:glutamate-5-semialdehyde dehydrogenase
VSERSERTSVTSTPLPLERLEPGQLIIVGGDRAVAVTDELAAAFSAGDRLVVLPDIGDVLHIPAAEHVAAAEAVSAASAAFEGLAGVTDQQITAFFSAFADRLADEASIAAITEANAADVGAASVAGRSTTRLTLSPGMREDMIAGLRAWERSPLRRDIPVAAFDHDGWSIEARRAPLGVVGFVFEGRPNVFADAAGVVRTGNTVVMRIGSDALGTAEAIVEHALAPALAVAGLPSGTVTLVRSRSRAAGWALFADDRLSLAVARGSGQAVAQLGAVARQAGTPVSAHGTGGAWLVAGIAADTTRFADSVRNSLDRKVCNTLNVCCIPAGAADRLVACFLSALDDAAAELGTSARLHVDAGAEPYVPVERFSSKVTIRRADGDRLEPAATLIDRGNIGTEWEWEVSPEVTLVVTETVAQAVALHNRYSPRFIASLISDDAAEHERFYAAVDAPFVGDGFTRWVDGQYALGTPELGLSNWQFGRLLGRGGVLSGESIHTIRHRATIDDPTLHR